MIKKKKVTTKERENKKEFEYEVRYLSSQGYYPNEIARRLDRTEHEVVTALGLYH